jgi:hypothetical protein
MRSRRGLRVRLGPVRVSVVRKRFNGPRTVVARYRRCTARQTPCKRLFRARSRVSEVRLVAPTGVATGDASDRLLHSETVPTRALVLRRFPALRPTRAIRFFRYASSEGRSRPGTLRLRARSRERLFFARRFARPKTREPGTGRLGAARCERGRGESRFTAWFPLRRPDGFHSVAFSSAVRNR